MRVIIAAAGTAGHINPGLAIANKIKQEALKKRVDEHDVKIKEVETSLKQGNDKFRKQEETNATFKSVMLSFVNCELAYCANTGYEDNQDLLDAKRELNEYLTGKHHEKEDRN